MRILIVPDPQAKPGNDLRYMDWAGKAIADYRPDIVVNMGDTYDMPSLSTHAQAGSKELEGARYRDDIDAGNEALDRLTVPFRKLGRYKPELVMLTGNHENRIERAVARDPKLEGVIGYHDFELAGFTRYEYLEVVWRQGIAFSHYFQHINSSHAIGGSIDSRLNRIGCSFVQGHEQGFKYGNRVYPTGRIYHGLVAGSYYLHDEGYKGRQGNGHWRGLVVLNGCDGQGGYDVMPLSIEYLQGKYDTRRKRK